MIVAQENTSVPKKVLIGKIFALPNGHYYPFGKESRGSSTANRPKEQFTGKERDSEIGLDYFGARYYNAEIGRWTSVDPLSMKYPSLTPYNFTSNNPISSFDPNGKYAISVHYKLTYDAMTRLGYSQDMADKMAHMASVYADNPGLIVRIFESVRSGINLYRRDGVDYSGTTSSQNDDENVIRHAMLASGDTRSRQQAVMDGLKFGWDHIFKAAQFETSSDMNSDFMRNFGPGIHALQDAFAHGGATMAEHLGPSKSTPGMIANDLAGPSGDAANLSESAGLVLQILKGDFTNVKAGMIINAVGMSSSQVNQLMGRLQSAGYNVIERKKKKDEDTDEH